MIYIYIYIYIYNNSNVFIYIYIYIYTHDSMILAARRGDRRAITAVSTRLGDGDTGVRMKYYIMLYGMAVYGIRNMICLIWYGTS